MVGGNVEGGGGGVIRPSFVEGEEVIRQPFVLVGKLVSVV